MVAQTRRRQAPIMFPQSPALCSLPCPARPPPLPSCAASSTAGAGAALVGMGDACCGKS